MDAQLVLERQRLGVVAGTQRAVRVHQELRHDVQRQALGTGDAVGRARQHQVDDVVGEIVVAVGDEDLLAAQPIAAVVDLLGAGADGAQIGAGLRFGQVHGSGPFAGHQLRQVSGFLLVGADFTQRVDGSLGQQRAQPEGEIGALPHLLQRGGDQPGQAHAAPFLLERRAVPAALNELPVGVGEPVRGAHHAVLQPRALLVTDRVQRCQHATGQFAGLCQDLLHQRAVGAIEPRQGGHPAEPDHVVDHEAHVAQRRGVDTHGSLPYGPDALRRRSILNAFYRGRRRGAIGGYRNSGSYTLAMVALSRSEPNISSRRRASPRSWRGTPWNDQGPLT